MDSKKIVLVLTIFLLLANVLNVILVYNSSYSLTSKSTSVEGTVKFNITEPSNESVKEPVVEPEEPSLEEPSDGGGGSYCKPEWSCTGWSECGVDGYQVRNCTDMNKCKSSGSLVLNVSKPVVERSCDYNPVCNDGIKNGNESGIDCGGNECKSCGLRKMCDVDSDCKSGNCVQGECREESVQCVSDMGCSDGRVCKSNECVIEKRTPKPGFYERLFESITFHYFLLLLISLISFAGVSWWLWFLMNEEVNNIYHEIATSDLEEAKRIVMENKEELDWDKVIKAEINHYDREDMKKWLRKRGFLDE